MQIHHHYANSNVINATIRILYRDSFLLLDILFIRYTQIYY